MKLYIRRTKITCQFFVPPCTAATVAAERKRAMCATNPQNAT